MDWATLLRQIDDTFNEEELKTLCFELSVDYDNLGGETKKGKARELIATMQRQRRVNTLIDTLAATRPNITWQRPSPDRQKPPPENLPAQNNERRRPARGGDSVSHYRAGAFTFSCLVAERGHPQNVYLLCDLGGLRLSGKTLRPGDPIIQPGQADGGSLSQDSIASLTRWGTIKDDPLQAAENIAAALAQVQSLANVSPEMGDTGFIKGVRSVEADTPVFGIGRTSGKVKGTIRQLDATIEMLWPVDLVESLSSSGSGSDRIPILFGGLIRCTFMLEPGDGGMILLDEDNFALGLGFSGNDEESYFIPMAKVLDALNVDLVTAEVWQAILNPADKQPEDSTPLEAETNLPPPTGTPTLSTDLTAVQSQLAELRRQLRRNRLVLFVGADFPQSVTGLPSRAELAADLARRKGLAPGQALTAVAQSVMADGSRWEFTDFLRDATDTVGKQPQALHQAIVALVAVFHIETIITTAYDDMLDYTFRQAGQGVNVVVRESDLSFVSPDRPTLIRLFGQSRQPDTLVVTEQDHNALLRGRLKAEIMAEVAHALRRNSLLYLGHDLNDATISALIDDQSSARSPRSYALWGGLSTQEKEFFRSQRHVDVLEIDPLSMLQTLADE